MWTWALFKIYTCTQTRRARVILFYFYAKFLLPLQFFNDTNGYLQQLFSNGYFATALFKRLFCNGSFLMAFFTIALFLTLYNALVQPKQYPLKILFLSSLRTEIIPIVSIPSFALLPYICCSMYQKHYVDEFL